MKALLLSIGLSLFSQSLMASTQRADSLGDMLAAHATSTDWRFDAGCGLSAPAQELALLIMSDSGQRRPRLRCNRLLGALAAERARELANAGEVNHFYAGRSPNMLLRRAGFSLPRYYPFGRANQVEALAGGLATAAETWQTFKHSSGHREHLLGEHAFYAEQDQIGVGFYSLPSSPHVEYWVVFVARRGQADVHNEAMNVAELCALTASNSQASSGCDLGVPAK